MQGSKEGRGIVIDLEGFSFNYTIFKTHKKEEYHRIDGQVYPAFRNNSLHVANCAASLSFHGDMCIPHLSSSQLLLAQQPRPPGALALTDTRAPPHSPQGALRAPQREDTCHRRAELRAGSRFSGSVTTRDTARQLATSWAGSRGPGSLHSPKSASG